MQENKRTINMVFWAFVVLCGIAAQVSILAGTDSGVAGGVTLIVIGFAWLLRNLAVGAHRAPPSPGTYCVSCRHPACVAARTARNEAALDAQDPEMARLGLPEFTSTADVDRALQGSRPGRRPGRR